ncbi:SNF5-domain-containing protein [Polychaeton citri CBS 116435]|uniref:SNF5-domain-containing protein n=1 Tax=Polychaeton citri CBS 116435 TaxID=1314669 RepID=A0A9P4Q832_9PEZI|nr:SNF5-domain-containing protein [Polychaeton citri CBS 116435]
MSNFNDQAYHQWNAGGAVQDAIEYSGSTSDAIREGKQKAKDVMAAAGLGPGTPSGQHGQPSSMLNGSSQQNGTAQLSRKRSRDGSQKPLVDAAGSEGERRVNVNDGVLLDRYMQRDLLHGAAMNDQATHTRELLGSKQMQREFYETEVMTRRRADPGSIFGYGYMGYGNGITNDKSQILYTSMRRPPKGRRNQQLRIPRKENARQAEEIEELVPIRLEVELDRLRIRDTFTWNLNERVISPDQFIDYLLEDLRVPPEAVPEASRQIKAEVHDSLQNYYPHPFLEDGALEPGRPYSEHKDDEMRIQIKLNITIGRITLVDQLEWDINNPLNLAEDFARQMAQENALSGEFTTAIAHSIREQCQLFTKSLYLTNHPFDGRPVEDPDVRDAFLSAPLNSAFRQTSAQKDWMPYMYEISENEVERIETSMMREHRAQKRQLNRRGGPALPDLKDRQRTVRSLLIHTVIPGAVETFEATGILKVRRGGRGGRRGPRNDGEVDSEDLESDDEEGDSPAPSTLNAGTARTRGMRGAAAHAQAAMRASQFGARSATPEASLLGSHEPRIASRRSMLREESVVVDDEQTLIVKLKLNKSKFKAWIDAQKAKKRAAEFPLSGYASQPPAGIDVRGSTPGRGAALSTPSMTPRSLPHSRNTPQPNGSATRVAASMSAARQSQTRYDDLGRVTVDTWPTSDQAAQPPPPPWLSSAIQSMRQKWSDSDFEATMRPSTINAETGQTARVDPLSPGDAPPAGVRIQYVPRIRCNDCPGKLYTASPGAVEDQFSVHLKNRQHRANVEARERSSR